MQGPIPRLPMHVQQISGKIHHHHHHLLPWIYKNIHPPFFCPWSPIVIFLSRSHHSMYLLCKLLYITVFGLLTACPPYFALYYHNVLRFSSDQIGFTIAIAPFVQSIACPIWAYVVDKRPNLHGVTMAITGCIGCLSVMCIMGIGHYVQAMYDAAMSTFSSSSHGGGSDSSNGSIVMATCALSLAFAFFALPNVALVDSAVMKILGPNKILYGKCTHTFVKAHFLTCHMIYNRGTTSMGIRFCWTDYSSRGCIDVNH